MPGPPDPATATQLVLAEAHRLGFDSAGVAPARIPEFNALALESWLAAGMAAGMGYMERTAAVRQDPTRFLAGARFAVAVAHNYHQGPLPGPRHIARYALGRDYHRVMHRPLRELGRYIERTIPGARARLSADAHPVMEKVLAVQAGLGWMGKHGNVLNRDFSGWLLLGAVITTAGLEPTPPQPDGCGTCTACLEACPTGAFAAPYVVDARKCLSYATIEHKGPLPESAANASTDWLFGCDDCLDACPYNRFAQATRHPDYQPRAGAATTPGEYPALSAPAFLERFQGTPVMRAGRDGMARNAAAWLERGRYRM